VTLLPSTAKRYGHFFLPVSFFICLSLIAPGWLRGDTAPDYGDTLVLRAKELRLHEDRRWHTLVHYRKTLRGTRSLIDDPKFFLSPRGKTDPRAELEATIRAIASPPREGEKTAACRFVARYRWLKDMLSIDENLLHVKGCAELEDSIDRMRPESVTMVFPASHINSPASMFGHTFLMIETGNRSTLLAHAVNYSASARDTFGPLFYMKSIFGLYPGYFGILPYYAKIQEYNDFDQRGIWEYRINFTAEEVRRMIYHIYELENVHSDYFFFDENCSYNLLFLLDAARPDLRLSDEFYSPWFTWVIPLDTIRGVRRTGIVGSIDFRPSRVSTIRHLQNILSEPGKDLALDVIRGKKEPDAVLQSPLPEHEKVRVCDMVTEYVRYEYSRDNLEKKEYTDYLIKTLAVRSRLKSTGESEYRVPVPLNPESGHLSARLALGAGTRGDSPFQELRVRPAYHTIIDNDDGYVEGGHIVFTDIVARFYDREKLFQLERFDAVDIVSLTPGDRFIQSASWKVSTGLRRRQFVEGENPLLGFLNTGGGYAWKVPVLDLIYVMGDAEVQAGGSLEHRVTAGAGASAGLLTKITRSWKVHLSAKSYYYPFGEKQHETAAALSQRIRTGVNSCVMIDAGHTTAASKDLGERRSVNELLLYLNVYL